MALKIQSGVQKRPQKIVIYGAEGIGKSTLASHFPKPLFFDLENGTSQLDVDRIRIETWTELEAVLVDVARDPMDYRTIVIDTIDAAEQMAIRHICETEKKTSIEEFGYGKGYTYVSEKIALLLSHLDTFIKKGLHIVILAHAKMRKFEQPDEMGAYDRWELKLTRNASPLVKEWADMLLFCNYKTNIIVDKDTKSKKAKGGKRVVYTTHNPCWDAKNRHGMPDVLDMDYDEISKYLPSTETDVAPDPEDTGTQSAYEKLKKLMDDHGVKDEDVETACVMAKIQPKNKQLKDYDPAFIEKNLIAPWDKFFDFIERKVWKVPFKNN